MYIYFTILYVNISILIYYPININIKSNKYITMNCLETEVLDEIITNSVRTSASRLYKAASLTDSPSIYSTFKHWFLDGDSSASADASLCGGSKILKKVS